MFLPNYKSIQPRVVESMDGSGQVAPDFEVGGKYVHPVRT